MHFSRALAAHRNFHRRSLTQIKATLPVTQTYYHLWLLGGFPDKLFFSLRWIFTHNTPLLEHIMQNCQLQQSRLEGGTSNFLEQPSHSSFELPLFFIYLIFYLSSLLLEWKSTFRSLTSKATKQPDDAAKTSLHHYLLCSPCVTSTRCNADHTWAWKLKQQKCGERMRSGRETSIGSQCSKFSFR